MYEDTYLTTFAYASSIRVCDLLAAGRTFSAVEPTLRGLDLLARRKRRNVLLATRDRPHAAVTQVPVEMWARVKQAVIEQELKRVRLQLRGEFPEHCDIEPEGEDDDSDGEEDEDEEDEDEEDDEEDGNGAEEQGARKPEQGTGDWRVDLKRSESEGGWAANWIDRAGWGGEDEDLDFAWLLFNDRELDNLKTPLTRLLASFGLRLPTPMDMLNVHEHARAQADLPYRSTPRSDHLTNVALLLPGYDLEATFEPETGHTQSDRMNGGCELAVPAAVFELPRDADNRFARFRAAYRVDGRLEGLRSSRPQLKVITKMRAQE